MIAKKYIPACNAIIAPGKTSKDSLQTKVYNGDKTRGVAASKDANKENIAPSSFDGVTFDKADLIIIEGVLLNNPIAAPEKTFQFLNKLKGSQVPLPGAYMLNKQFSYLPT